MGEICATGGRRAYAVAVRAGQASLSAGCVLVVCLAGCATHVTPSASSVTIPDLRNPCDGAGCAPATPASYPTNAAALPTLGLETLAGELGRANNTWDTTRRHASLHVVVPEGRSLASTVVCRGLGSVRVSTYPMSSAAQTVSCDRSAAQARVRAAGTPERIGKAYDVTVTLHGPSRWVVAVAAQ